MTRKAAAVWLSAVLLGGCSSVNVVKSPSPGDNGIRFYRPKPYLLVTPADPTGRMVKLEVLQLPDYSEEYSIHPKGKKPPAVQLQDGWNLVGVGPGGPPPKGEAAPPPPPADPLKLPEAVLVAGNVPIGLYESVFDYGGPVKSLKGWRYVGFAPWGGGLPNGTDREALANVQKGCPPGVANGSVVQGPLYGLVFFNGAMTFRQLDEIANNMTCPEYVKPYNPPPPPAPLPAGVRTEPTTPSAPGVVVPSETAPPPPAANPGPSTMQVPAPGPASIDTAIKTAAAEVRPPAPAAPVVVAALAPPAVVKPAPVTVRPAPVTVRPAPAAVRPAPAAVRPAPASAKPVDPKALARLEADVFRSLNLPPAPAPATVAPASSSNLPPLTPAMPLP